MCCGCDWENRSDTQKISLICAVVCCIAATIGVISNIALMDIAAKNSWYSDDEKQRFLFFLNRIFAMLLNVLCILSELHVRFEFIRKWFKALKFFFVRGLLAVFTGITTLTGDSMPGSGPAAVAWSSGGWILFGVGILYIIFSVLCFKEYSEEQREIEKQQNPETSAAAGGDQPPQELGNPPPGIETPNVAPPVTNDPSVPYRI